LSWDIALDFKVSPNQANSNPDRCGASNIWSFYRSLVGDTNTANYTLLSTFDSSLFGIQGLQAWHGTKTISSSPDALFPFVGLNTTSSQQTGWLPGQVSVHPHVQEQVIVSWRSPFNGFVAIQGKVQQTATGNGDGINWQLRKDLNSLDTGTILNPGSENFAIASASVTTNQRLYLVIQPRTTDTSDRIAIEFRVTRLP
jgi:hypothetical protein